MSRIDEAAQWAARIDAGAIDEIARAGLEKWLAIDPLNKGALLRAQAMLCLIDEAPDKAIATRPREDAALPPAPEHRPQRRWRLAGGAAAVAAAGVLALAIPQADHARYATETGEVREVAMADGSRAIINTASRLDTEMTQRQRRVSIEQGEAWFQIAKDSDRPFIVSAGPIRIKATGTAFAVRRLPGSATVTVTEGTVEIWNSAAPDARFPARAGQSTTFAFAPLPNAEPRIVPARESALAWRDEDIVLEGMTLGEAVEQFNRYNLRQIRIGSPGIAATPMLGYFKINQPEQFAVAASEVIGGDIVHDGNNIVIIKTSK